MWTRLPPGDPAPVLSVPMSSNQYFEESPRSPSEERPIDVVLPDLAFSMHTDRGVFSHGRLDKGTRILLREAPPPPPTGVLVDLGCGAGAIALTLAMRAEQATVLAVDVNARARSLCAANAAQLGLKNVTVVHPDQVPAMTSVDAIWSNPPIRVGKPALHAMLAVWLERLRPGAAALLVVQRNLGAESLEHWLRTHGFVTTKVAARAGYRLIEVAAQIAEGGESCSL